MGSSSKSERRQLIDETVKMLIADRAIDKIIENVCITVVVDTRGLFLNGLVAAVISDVKGKKRARSGPRSP